MQATHEMTFSRLCPVNDGRDEYRLTVTTMKMLKVEDILAAVDKLPPKAFQEDLTAALAAALGCMVCTIGYHSGIKTTCCAG